MNKLTKFKYRLFHGKIPAYIHIPKTGGTYLGQIETDKQSIVSPINYLGHCVIKEKNINLISYPPKSFTSPTVFIKKEIEKNYEIFTTVRNIYDWLVSYWHHAGGIDGKYVDKNHYDYNLAQKGFSAFVSEIADRDGDIWPSKRFIFFQAFSYEGSFLPKWVNRTRTLDKNLEEYAKKKRLSYTKKRKQRVSKKKKSYTEHYSNYLIKLVKNTWKREMDLYGFEFKNNSFKNAYIKKNVTDKIRDNVKYKYSQDKLYINSKEIK